MSENTGETGSLSKKALVIGLVMGLIIGLIFGYAMALPAVDTAELEQRITDLEGEMGLLESENEALKSSYTSLNTSYTELSENYDKLKEDYDELIESGEAIAFERLKVTSKLMPCFVDNTLVSYIVRVNATNIGDKPLDKVCIFIFAYGIDKSGRVSWSYTSGSLNTEPLYIGETYRCEFTDLSKDVTTYKVFAVAS